MTISISIVPEKFYTSEEVSEFLRLSLRTVQRLLANRSLNAYKIHGQYRIKGLDLLRYLDSTRQDDQPPAPQTPARYTEFLNVHPLTLRVGQGWLPLIEATPDSEVPQTLMDRLPALRQDVVKTLGFVLPGLRVEDNLSLAESDFEIFLQGVSVLKSTTVSLVEPQLALDALVDSLKRVVCRHAHEMLSRDDVAVMVEMIREKRPVVVEEVMRTELNPQGLTLGQLTQVLRYLLKESVSIQHMGLILEGLADHLTEMPLDAPVNSQLGEALRQYLCRQINAPLANAEGIIEVLTLDPDLEQYLEAGAQGGQPDDAFYTVLNGVRTQLKEAPASVIICSLPLRRYLFSALYRHYPQVTVLSYQEIHEDYRVKPLLSLVKGV